MAKELPSILHIKPDEVDTPEKRGKYTVSVIGCGLRGILYAEAFAEAGFKVVCADANQSIVKRISKGNVKLANREETETKIRGFVRKGQLTATSDLKAAVTSSDVVIVTVGAKIDAKKAPDYSEAENVSKQVGAALPKESLVVYGGVAGFGFVEEVVKETIENTSGLKVGEDFGFAYNLLQIPVVFGGGHIGDFELGVAATDKSSLNAACLVFGTIAKKGVKRISSVKMAELAALFASAKRDANLALANELAIFCENAGVDYKETSELADGDICASYAPTIAEEDNRNEAYLLLESAENLTSKLRVTALARQINEEMIKHATNLTQNALRSCGKALRRARIALLGTVAADTAAAAFVEMLSAKGAKITRYDPMGVEVEQAGVIQSFRKTLNETAEGADCIVILTGQEQFKHLNLKKLRAVMRSPSALIDLAGVIEPSKAENEGFAYRGLGRGVWKK